MEVTSYGVMFINEDEEVWIGKYENDTIREFFPFSNYWHVDEDLVPDKFIFVAINEGSSVEEVYVNNICVFEIGRGSMTDDKLISSVTAEMMLNEMEFPSNDTDELFRQFLVESGKTN